MYEIHLCFACKSQSYTVSYYNIIIIYIKTELYTGQTDPRVGSSPE